MAQASAKTTSGSFQDPGKLGTFIGVFTPTLLTILGVIMYLRFGWMVGHMGLAKSLGIIVLANAITLATTLSFSAIATNTQVGVGGAYFMISRSLGLEIGGAIGLPLFLSQVFSTTLYAYGLAESIQFIPGLEILPTQPLALVIIVAVAALSIKGAQMALKTQLPVMGLVAISILALFVGAALHTPSPAETVTTGETVSFWAVFAVIFPAVTGVMAGLGLSGDLKDPRVAIPRGSISAALTGFVVYLFIVVALYYGADAEALKSDQKVWGTIAPFGLGMVIILPGLWGAIFSSAVGSMLAAPRTLQAMAQDHSHRAPWLKFLAGPEGKEPVVGMFIAAGLSVTAVFLGDLNTVAEVVSMFFLTVYGTVNLVSALESVSGDSTWRPTLRVHWSLSLAGALGCFAVMFLINPAASVAAITIEIVLWIFFQRLEWKSEWGDMRRDIYEALIRWALIRLAHHPMTARNWRPHVLIFTHDIETRLHLLQFAHWIGQGRGVVTVCELIVGDILEAEVDPKVRQEEMRKFMHDQGIVAFGEVALVRNVQRGMIDVSQANGMAGLQSNTVVMGVPRTAEKLAESLQVLQRLEQLNKSVVFARMKSAQTARQGRRRRIDVWWGGLERNGDLMLLFAHLMTLDPQWRGAHIRIVSIASNEHKQAETETQLQELLPEARINAEARVIVMPKDATVREVIHRESESADAVFLGLATPKEGEELPQAERMMEMAEGLRNVYFVKNATRFVGKLV